MAGIAGNAPSPYLYRARPIYLILVTTQIVTFNLKEEDETFVQGSVSVLFQLVIQGLVCPLPSQNLFPFVLCLSDCKHAGSN